MHNVCLPRESGLLPKVALLTLVLAPVPSCGRTLEEIRSGGHIVCSVAVKSHKERICVQG